MKAAISFVATLLVTMGASHAAEALRVCADPNNLPYSNAAGAGFENKIARLIADRLGRPLQFVWRAQRRGFLREGLKGGECDLVTATPPGLGMIRSTRPYYRSSYVFVSRPGEPPVSSFDDPSLRRRLIGVQLVGDDAMNTPPAHALARRGIVDNVRGYLVFGDYGKPDPSAAIVRAVATHAIDVAAVWGPIAGYYAQEQHPPLVLSPITPPQDAPIPMSFDIAMGVRRTDLALLDSVQRALDALKPEIKATLAEYHVPTASLE
jgi:mxaJ protein